jgi:hypothetical protein
MVTIVDHNCLAKGERAFSHPFPWSCDAEKFVIVDSLFSIRTFVPSAIYISSGQAPARALTIPVLSFPFYVDYPIFPAIDPYLHSQHLRPT